MSSGGQLALETPGHPSAGDAKSPCRDTSSIRSSTRSHWRTRSSSVPCRA